MIATLAPKQRYALIKDLNTSAFVKKVGQDQTVKKVRNKLHCLKFLADHNEASPKSTAHR